MNFRVLFHAIISLSASLALCGPAGAHDYKAGELRIAHPYARPTVPNQPAGAAYLTIENKGTQSDRLMSLASPAAKTVEVHTMTMEGNVMKMREAPALELKPSTKIEMHPGSGYHIMLVGLQAPLKTGDKFPLSLTFEKSGKVDVMVFVEDKERNAAPEPAAHKHH
ncbi:MAG: rane protein [Herminiimonas sp.]|nr:rane protein [Herminiimonas sp.]